MGGLGGWFGGWIFAFDFLIFGNSTFWTIFASKGLLKGPWKTPSVTISSMITTLVTWSFITGVVL